MVKSICPIATAAGALCLLLAACDPSTVEIGFEPDVGDRYEFESDVTTDVETTLDGDTEARSDESMLSAAEEVVSVEDDEVTIEVALERDGVPARTYSVRYNRGDRLSAIDLIEGAPAEAVGLDLATDLPADLAGPPSGPLDVGMRWEIARTVEATDGEEDEPILITGAGRVRSLGVQDGRDVAIVEVTLEVPIRSRIDTASGLVHLSGTQVSVSTSTYDLTDGAVRSDETTITGSVDLVIEPPEGIEAAAVPGSIDYEVTTDTRRVAAT